MRSLYKFPGGRGLKPRTSALLWNFPRPASRNQQILPFLLLLCSYPVYLCLPLWTESRALQALDSMLPSGSPSLWNFLGWQPVELVPPCLVSTSARVLWCKLQLNEIVFLLGRPIEGLAPGTESFCIELLRSLKTWTAHCSCGVLESMGSEPKSCWGTH